MAANDPKRPYRPAQSVKDMKSSSSKSLIETFGVVAIIVSLLFLGYELKRANDIAEAEATSTVYQAGNEYLLTYMVDQNLRHAWHKLLEDGSESLTVDEQRISNTALTYIYNIHVMAWKFLQKGLMSDADMATLYFELCFMITDYPAIAEDWANRRDLILPGFYDDVSRECEISNE